MSGDNERRRHKRVPINVKLCVERVYKQDEEIISNLDANISVIDISKSGLGFISKASLPVGYYFDGTIGLGDADYFRAVLKIVRSCEYSEESICYGAEFVGLAPFLIQKVDDYEKMLHKKFIF